MASGGNVDGHLPADDVFKSDTDVVRQQSVDAAATDRPAAAAVRDDHAAAAAGGPKTHRAAGQFDIRVRRPIYSQDDFNRKFNFASSSDDTRTVCRRLGDGVARRCRPSPTCLKRSLLSMFPFVGIMKEYGFPRDLLSDVIAGLTVGVMHVPQGMAYGMLTQLEPVYGLYASFFPVIFYFFFGTSRHISIGTFAVVTLMIGTVVTKSNCEQLYPTAAPLNVSSGSEFGGPVNLTQSNSDDLLKCKVGVAVTLTLVVGIYQILMGLFKLGFVTIYLSDPLTRALTMAAAVHVFTSQVKLVFGVQMGRFNGAFKLVYTYAKFFENIAKTNVASLLMALICIVIIYSVQRWLNPIVKKKIKMPVPIELIVLIFGTLISYLASFDTRFKMKTVGKIPTGIPTPEVPPMYRFTEVASDAIGIAIVAFTINISMAKLFAKKHSYRLDPNQELLAYGITNSVCSMFNCFVSCASLSRSLVQEAAGGRTQVSGLVSCSLLLVVLLAIAPLFRHLPQCVLAAIVIVNLKGVLMQITDVRSLYKKGQYYDLIIWLVTAIAVVLTEVDTGLFIGIGFSLLTIVFRTQRPHTCLLGRIPQTDIYQDIKTYPLAREIPGIKIFSFTSSLYYANAEFFAQRLYKKSKCNPEIIKSQIAKMQRKLAAAEKKKRHEKVAAQNKKQQLNITAEQDEKMFTEVTTSPSAISNGEHSSERGHDVTATNSNTEIKLEVTDIILDCSSMLFIDTVGVSTLQQVIKDYKDIGIRVFLACCREPVFDQLDRAGFFKKSDLHIVYVGVHDAVLAAVQTHAALYQQLKSDLNGPLGSVLNAALYSDSDEYRSNGGVRNRLSSLDEELNTTVLESAEF